MDRHDEMLGDQHVELDGVSPLIRHAVEDEHRDVVVEVGDPRPLVHPEGLCGDRPRSMPRCASREARGRLRSGSTTSTQMNSPDAELLTDLVCGRHVLRLDLVVDHDDRHGRDPTLLGTLALERAALFRVRLRVRGSPPRAPSCGRSGRPRALLCARAVTAPPPSR